MDVRTHHREPKQTIDPALVEPLSKARAAAASLPDLAEMYNDKAAIVSYEMSQTSNSTNKPAEATFDSSTKIMSFDEKIVSGNPEHFIDVSNHEHIHGQQTELKVDAPRTGADKHRAAQPQVSINAPQMSVEDYMRYSLGHEAAAFAGQYDIAYRKALQGEPQYLDVCRKYLQGERPDSKNTDRTDNLSAIGLKYDEVMERHFPDGNIDMNSEEFTQARKEALGAAYSEFFKIEDNAYHSEAYAEYMYFTLLTGVDRNEDALTMTDERDSFFHLKDKIDDTDLSFKYFAKDMTLGDLDYSGHVDKKLFEDDEYFRKTMEGTGATDDSFAMFRGWLEDIAISNPKIKETAMWGDAQEFKYKTVPFSDLDKAIEQYKEDGTPPMQTLGFTIATQEQNDLYRNADQSTKNILNFKEFMVFQNAGKADLVDDYILYRQKAAGLDDARVFKPEAYLTLSQKIGMDVLNDYLDMRLHFQSAGMPREGASLGLFMYAQAHQNGQGLDPDKMLKNMTSAITEITQRTKEYNPVLAREAALGANNPALVSALDKTYEKIAKILDESKNSEADLQSCNAIMTAANFAIISKNSLLLEDVIKDKNNPVAQGMKDELNALYTQTNPDFKPEAAPPSDNNAPKPKN